MSNRPDRYNANLPRNLTFRKSRQSYYWRNPVTGQEIPLGRISRREAVSQALEANNYIDENYIPSSLLLRLKEKPEFTFSLWLDRYAIILSRRELKPNTMKIRNNQLKTLCAEFGTKAIENITTREIAIFLDSYIESGKKNMAAALRSLLLDVFREAIVEGVIERNPAEPTRTPTPDVKRERMSLEQFTVIRSAAQSMSNWLANAMDIALLTGQRREDISKMTFDDIRDGRIFITQGKTGHMLAVPLSLTLNVVSLSLDQVVERCRAGNPSEFLIYSTVRKGGRKPGAVLPDAITSAFADARDKTALEFAQSPPSFHEIRSLASRLYAAEKGEEFAQRLLGHKNMSMTKKYLDSRGQEFDMV
ncbi:tyrosine-type recombinase/integrase [Candidatus Pantoea multigeneris]|uniref:Tyrosine-type recombinase/integrase n=1 Tax=Candidatus Pantoea multigeneris TaxID=2608357 RepID=A0ABX0R7G8_9GAMM|nr:tyrosine-type recombinase/integrase [Pantoea multigeneris]NIF20297.1 tyrosine-type recombinase/integrase [Pantoea multigeneris]